MSKHLERGKNSQRTIKQTMKTASRKKNRKKINISRKK